jgi:uncharacterized membrane protein YkvA (DUF1232 family)
MAFARLSNVWRRANRVRLGVHLLALWKLLRHRDTPRAPKVVALLVLAYALSPIDLIPDFIPVLGMLDDLILLPLGVAVVVRLTPTALWQARVAEAEAHAEALPRLWWGALLVVLVWALLLVLFVWWLGTLFVSGVGS